MVQKQRNLSNHFSLNRIEAQKFKKALLGMIRSLSPILSITMTNFRLKNWASLFLAEVRLKEEAKCASLGLSMKEIRGWNRVSRTKKRLRDNLWFRLLRLARKYSRRQCRRQRDSGIQTKR
jgi:hypothetical protein